jgi:hypothetical protein
MPLQAFEKTYLLEIFHDTKCGETIWAVEHEKHRKCRIFEVFIKIYLVARTPSIAFGRD